jgi:hypothetical protein
MRYRWGPTLVLLAAALAWGGAHGLDDVTAAAAEVGALPATGSAGLDELLEMHGLDDVAADAAEESALTAHTMDALPALTGSAGLDELLEMLNTHSKSMSLQQLRELRAVMQRMRDSAEKRRDTEDPRPGGRRQSIDRMHDQAYDVAAGGIIDTYTKGRVYSVIIYPQAPFVVIGEPGTGKVQDPGNVNQTRTPSNGLLSGMTIELLEEIAVMLGVRLKYYYPCAKARYEATGKCDEAIDSEALDWLKSGDRDLAMAAKYFGNVTDFCGGKYRCFVAGPIKVVAQRMEDFRMTQSYMDTGFSLAVKKSKAAPPLLSAFLPFEGMVWFALFIEILLYGLGFVYIEGYGTNEALWAAPDTSELQGCAKTIGKIYGFFIQFYDAGYWATTILLGKHASGSVCAHAAGGVEGVQGAGAYPASCDSGGVGRAARWSSSSWRRQAHPVEHRT